MNHRLLPYLLSCDWTTRRLCLPRTTRDLSKPGDDIAALTKMVRDREAAMKSKDLPSVMVQFSDDATFINWKGSYYANKSEVEAFHKQLIFLEGVGYNYSAGKVTVRLLDENNALVYYPWKMDFFHVAAPTEFFSNEVGLMTLSAQKRKGNWLWVAITNQHTQAFVEDLITHRVLK
jgi:uncharacterized protein (TIGR02246 family)